MSGFPHIGFDVIANKISNIHQDVLPANCSALGAVAVVGFKVKLSFNEALGG
jgi:hypothetical protein